MIITPKIRGFICLTAHPVGCEQVVKEQIDFVRAQGYLKGQKRVLVIGASTGYGLASRIVATFACHAKTIGVFFEKPADETRTASAGWYNTAAFEKFAHQAGYDAKSINGDAFSDAVKEKVVSMIRREWGQVDLVIYSIASPRRIHPQTGKVYTSALKPIGQTFTGKTVDAFKGMVREVCIEPATTEEIEHTVAVMGGEDWALWINLLRQEQLLAQGVKTIAYSYIGPPLTYAIYREGTIGRAKEHLKETADQLNQTLQSLRGEAVIAVNKAVVTQASAAIPVVPLYIALLFKVMKEKHVHEGCIEQIYRLFHDDLYTTTPNMRDQEGYIRLDRHEMDAAIQQAITTLWPRITNENVAQLTDLEGYRHDFCRLFGFEVPTVAYATAIDPHVEIPSLEEAK